MSFYYAFNSVTTALCLACISRTSCFLSHSVSSRNTRSSFIMQQSLKLDDVNLPWIPSDVAEVLKETNDFLKVSLSTDASQTVEHISVLVKNNLELAKAILNDQFVNFQIGFFSLINVDSSFLEDRTNILYLVLAASALFVSLPTNPPLSPYPDNKYDALSAKKYFNSKPLIVVRRGMQIFLMSAGFGFGILIDILQKKLTENSEKRAIELSTLLSKLGPSFIKIGQSLSIRTDLLSPAYVKGLKSLQDQVPPFDTSTALQIIEEELSTVKNEDIFNLGSSKPIAAASLGQVYKSTLDNGVEVAVKVQRPAIMNQIALDMYLIRQVAPLIKRTLNLNTNLTGVIDTWGFGFVNELNYIAEAENAEIFMDSLKNKPLNEVVFAPRPMKDYCTSRILTTEWVDGERLDVSTKEDIASLCSVAMNTYLTMMLESSILHCDPHPGNLLRASDGRLCILDWGMITKLEPDLQVTLIEHMAHLTSADYAEIPNDLLSLGFIPKEKEKYIQDSDIVETLADVYSSWTAGGGAASVNVNEVFLKLQDLAVTRGNLFQIPPYFTYIAKSFSVLEGIGLSNDPKYSIVKECLPYVSKRLLTDNSERTGGALSTFIFGPDKNSFTRVIDYHRVEQLYEGFGSYTTSTTLGMRKVNETFSDQFDTFSDQVLDIIFTSTETPLQDIIIDQISKLMLASSKDVWKNIRKSSGTLPNGRSILGTIIDPLGIWRTSTIVSMTQSDTKIIQATRNIIQLIDESTHITSSTDFSSISNEEALDLSSILVRKIWRRRRDVLGTSRRVATKMIEITANRLEDPNFSTDKIESEKPIIRNKESNTELSPRLINALSKLNDLETGVY